MKIPALLLPILLLSTASPALELRIRRPVDACPVESTDRWGWRVEVFREAPGQWVIRATGTDLIVPDPPALLPLKEAVRVLNARLVYSVGIWNEDPDQALRVGRGNCISFTVVLERDLARLGYRTRRVHGLLFAPGGNSNPYYLAAIGATPHRWLEVFTPDHGWVPLDPVAPGGRLTGRHLAFKGDDTAGWLRDTRIEVLRWD